MGIYFFLIKPFLSLFSKLFFCFGKIVVSFFFLIYFYKFQPQSTGPVEDSWDKRSEVFWSVQAHTQSIKTSHGKMPFDIDKVVYSSCHFNILFLKCVLLKFLNGKGSFSYDNKVDRRPRFTIAFSLDK